ncbi:MAG TPA: hypothetical protein VGL95_00590 [Acetobacteraceae bacterium]|jgi:hypothetical protein
MNPFVGLRPFRENERHLFVGRELATAYVETKSSYNPLTLLFARSGIGKSSFLTSRLIPQLRESRRVNYVNEWGEKSPQLIVRDGIARLAAMPPTDDGIMHLILDQFEDVFKQDIDRRELWESFAEVASAESETLRIVVTMREEWLGAWQEVEQYLPTAFNSMVRLAPLTPKELTNAVLRPIAIAGEVECSSDLVPVLLGDLRQQNAYGLGEGFVEPGMLQLVCHRLWDEAYATSRRIDIPLYERLGRSNQIIREFVWRHLRGSGSSAVEFKTDERVLWAGMVRHLAVAHGVKSTVTPDSLCRKLLLRDLGMAGPAVAAGKGLAVQKYLAKPVERREASPPRLTAWITDTLETAHRCGFLKRQEGFKANTPQARLYELSHDGLDDIFRSFSLEFEKWVTRRIIFFWAVILILFFIAPYVIYIAYTIGPVYALLLIVGGVVGIVIYLGIIWVVLKLMSYLALITYYPIVRWLVGGRVNLRVEAGRVPDNQYRARTQGSSSAGA